MAESILIAFREGIEAFLIVAIAASYLVQTGRNSLLPALFSGVVAAILASYALGITLEDYANNAEFEGIMALTAAVLVGSLTIYVSFNANKLKAKLYKGIDLAVSKVGFWKYVSVFIFAFIMVLREGFEFALLMNVISYETESIQMYAGSAIGISFAVILGLVWLKFSHLINIASFLKVTAIFLFLFTIHLLIYGFHELSEVSAIPFIDNDRFHIATEDIAEGIWGDLFSYIIITLPFIYLLFSSFAKGAKQEKLA